MSAKLETLLDTPAGFRSREVARFFWQLEERRRALIEDTRALTPGELGWQVSPGMNTIGMLLAHIAYAETHLIQVGVLGEPTGHAQDVIGISEVDEGLPLAVDAVPPAALDGRDLAFFDDLLARARAHTHRALEPLVDADVERRVVRPPRPDGTGRVFNVGWVLYHLIEHEAGHHGQINLLRHLHRLAPL